MTDDFNNIAGAWPESYIFADSTGKAIWKSESGDAMSLNLAIEYAQSQNWA